MGARDRNLTFVALARFLCQSPRESMRQNVQNGNNAQAKTHDEVQWPKG
jgi:hypothetical protein